MPDFPATPGSFHSVKNVPVEFYEYKKTTEVLICEKCSRTHTVYY